MRRILVRIPGASASAYLWICACRCNAVDEPKDKQDGGFIFGRGPKISIIDIGAGTGGNFFGFLWALKDRCLVSGYNFPHIEFMAVEKNEEALHGPIELAKEFFPDQVNFKIYSSEFLSGADFLKNLTDAFRFEGSADLIMCWKFICEFYNSIEKYMKNNEMYGRLLNIAHNKLKPNGILAVCDVTKRAYNPDGNFLPSIMNRELHKVLISGKTDLIPIFPMSCAHWWEDCHGYANCFVQKHFRANHNALPSNKEHDEQGVCLKVFARKPFSDSLLNGENAAKGYILARNSNGVTTRCRHGKIERVTPDEHTESETHLYPDAFEWTGQGNPATA